jgi:hypothetical protein
MFSDQYKRKPLFQTLAFGARCNTLQKTCLPKLKRGDNKSSTDPQQVDRSGFHQRPATDCLCCICHSQTYGQLANVPRREKLSEHVNSPRCRRSRYLDLRRRNSCHAFVSRQTSQGRMKECARAMPAIDCAVWGQARSVRRVPAKQKSTKEG